MSGKMTKFKDLLVDTPNRYTVNGEVKTIVFAPNTITQEGTKDKAEYFNEMQKNGLYNVNATRVVEGTVEFYDVEIEGSDIFDVFDTQFIINFNETNTKLNPILRFNGNNYYIRALEGFIDIDVQVGSLQKTYIGFLDSTNNKLKLMNYERKLTFDTVVDLKTATWLIEGDTVQLLGYYSKNDGARHMRKIETTIGLNGIKIGELYANIIYEKSINPKWYGAIADNTLHILSERYFNISEAQELYPIATSLTDSIDWCSIQSALNDADSLFLKGKFHINKKITITSTKTIKFSNRFNDIIYQHGNDTPIIELSSLFHEFDGLNLEYVNQQTIEQINSVGIRMKLVSQSNLKNISIKKSNSGISNLDTYGNWNNVFSNVFIEKFSKKGIKSYKGSGNYFEGIFITSPYLICENGFEIQGGDYTNIYSINIEDGNYITPFLMSDTRVNLDSISFEKVTMKSDSAYLVIGDENSVSESTLNVRNIEMYNNKLNSIEGITRGCTIYSKQQCSIKVDGIKYSEFKLNYGTSELCDIPNVLFISDNIKTRAEITGIFGGTIVGTNDYNGSYDPLLSASVYTFVTNDDSNLGTELVKVNDTIYTRKFKYKIITPKVEITYGGGIDFTNSSGVNTNAKTLDYYEEGVFTPVLKFGENNASMTFSKQNGKFTRIGNVVNFEINIELISKGTSTGAATIIGLPFSKSVSKTTSIIPIMISFFNSDTTVKGIFASIQSNASKIGIISMNNNSFDDVVTDVKFSNNSSIKINGFYII